METNLEFYDKLYEILASIQYNSERRKILEDVLRNYLVERNSNIDIAAEARKSSTKELGIKDKNEPLKSRLFGQECLLLSNIPHQYIPEYIIQKFSRCSIEFEKIYGFNIDTLWIFAFKLLEYIEFKKNMIHFIDESYIFKSKNEYADVGFMAIPSKTYIEKWRNIITVSLSEIERLFSGVLSIKEIELILQLLSIDIGNLHQDAEHIRFPSTPLFKINDDTVILLTPWYLTRALPSIYESLFKKCKCYLNSKGKTFEKLAQHSLKTLPFKTLTFNAYYGNGFETDAIIAFKKSFWTVEVSSHPPSLKSLKGDIISINKDLKKTIKKCILQGKRCLEHTDDLHLTYFSKNAKTKGILIIVDGTYPQLNMSNMNMVVSFFEEKIPVYIINWFDLRTLLDQPEIEKFEDFLAWRTQQPMPVVCFDEKDYWGFYFDRYEKETKVKQAFETMKENHNILFYISYRFNNKDYLEKIVDGD